MNKYDPMLPSLNLYTIYIMDTTDNKYTVTAQAGFHAVFNHIFMYEFFIYLQRLQPTDGDKQHV
jgi:hypothetical protein